MVIGGPEATIRAVGRQPAPLYVARFTTLKFKSQVTRTVVTPAPSWHRSPSTTTASTSSGEYPETRSSRHHTAVPDEMDVRVDQPRQHRRIAVVDQLTIGRRLVPHRLDANVRLSTTSTVAPPARNPSPSKAWFARSRTPAWLRNPPAPVNAHPMGRSQREGLLRGTRPGDAGRAGCVSAD
jgi:hypothetical protein